MDYDMLLGSQRWKILEIITKKPSSPLEISKEMKTSVAYISQQLRLLEAAGLILKTRTGRAEAGKPRALFSIAKELAHITVLIRNDPIKKTVQMSERMKILLRIWAIDPEGLRNFIEDFYFYLGKSMDEIEGIYFDTSGKKAQVIVYSTSKQLASKAISFTKEYGHEAEIQILYPDKFVKPSSTSHILYDPKGILLIPEIKEKEVVKNAKQ